ncbi:autotransporter outer membrane beta-barrel domain-containing protein [Neisseria sp. Ec49-e6-T10]|uniref:autotransporter outer membrane beta-barrel domain-containing protein n=1 Tax=Neisseria sp. Ec49-e6-T10 TaxID=3140744 RepID=UPI003EBA7276
MKINKMVLALTALFASISTYAAEVPPDSFPAKEQTPNSGDVLNNPDYTNGYAAVVNRWLSNALAATASKTYISGETIVKTRSELSSQVVYMRGNSYSINNTLDSVQMNLEDGSIAIGTVLKGSVDKGNGTGNHKGVLVVGGGFNGSGANTKAYDTVVESDGSLSVGAAGYAYNTLVKQGGIQVVSASSTAGGYAQANIIDGGEQQISLNSHLAVAEDNIVINGGRQYIFGGTAKNSHIGSGSYQLASGLSLETTVYSGGFQLVYAGSSSTGVADQDSTIYFGGTQRIQQGISVGAKIYGEQIITNKKGSWVNGSWIEESGFWGSNPVAQNATIYAGGVQRIDANGQAIGTILEEGGIQHVNESGTATNTIVNVGGTQFVNKYGSAFNNVVNGGSQIVNEYGHIEDTTIQGGGSSMIAFGGYSFGDLNVKDGSLTMQAGDLHAWTHLLGKGAYAEKVNLDSNQARLFIQHNDATSESTVTIDALNSNNGSIIFGRKDGSDVGKFSRLNLETLTGSGTIVMNTNIAGQEGDFLHVENKIADPDLFKVVVRDTGAEISEYRHHLITAGTDSLADTFTMKENNSRADAGAYMVQYDLEHSTSDTTGKEDWHLVTKKLAITTPATDAVLAMSNVTPTIWDAELSTLRQRLGDLEDNKHNNGVWGKYITSRYKVDKEVGAAYKQDMNGFMIGADHAWARDNGTLYLGFMTGYSQSDIDFKRHGDGTVDSYTVGGYLTYMDNSGLYLDGVVKYNYFRNKMTPVSTNGLIFSGKYSTSGAGFSFELGKKYEQEKFFTAPYALISGFYAGSKNYTLTDGMHADVGGASSFKSELGNVLGTNFKLDNGGNIKPYVRLAVSYEFVDSNKVRINHTEEFNNDMSGAAVKVGLGVTAKLSSNFSTYAEIDYMKASHSSMPYSGNIGIRYMF